MCSSSCHNQVENKAIESGHLPTCSQIYQWAPEVVAVSGDSQITLSAALRTGEAEMFLIEWQMHAEANCSDKG